MSQILGSIKDFLTGVKYHKVHVDNAVFRLHYKVTALLLLSFGILIAERQYIGDPIDCITDTEVDKIVDQFCWVHGTYTHLAIDAKKDQIRYEKASTREDDVSYVIKKLQGNDLPSPKIEREFFNYKPGSVDEREFHKYYQWVWGVLFLMALFFYFPHWLWKTWEGGRMKTFVGDMNLYVVSDSEKQKQEEVICNYFCNPEKGQWSLLCWTPRGNHTIYALKYFFCELLTFVNLVVQIYCMDSFFNYGFSKYGHKLWSITESRPYARNDYFTKIFPIVTMCEIPIIGRTGTLVGHQAVCILPINVINEKVFVFLWVWFLLLLSVSALAICYRVLTIFPFPSVRSWLLLRLNHSMPKLTVDRLCRKIDFGDWFFLYLLGKNMNPIYYAEIITTLANRFDENESGATIPAIDHPWGGNDSPFRKGSLVA